MIDDHEVAEVELLVRRLPEKGNERGAHVYEKSLIQAAKDVGLQSSLCILVFHHC